MHVCVGVCVCVFVCVCVCVCVCDVCMMKEGRRGVRKYLEEAQLEVLDGLLVVGAEVLQLNVVEQGVHSAGEGVGQQGAGRHHG